MHFDKLASQVGEVTKQESKVVVVEDVLEEYGDIDTMLQMERLDECIDEVLSQMDELRSAVQKYESRLAEYEKRDELDKQDYSELYLEPAERGVNEILESFHMNGKTINLQPFFKGTRVEENVESFVDDLNRYIDDFMIGKDVPRIEHI